MKENITVYESNLKVKMGVLRSWYFMFKNIIDSRELIIQLFKRDFFAVYKKSFMGYAWILISPFVSILAWVLMNSTGILNPGDLEDIPYPVYVLIGTNIWGLFHGLIASASGTLTAGKGFIAQVKYPHEALLVKQVTQHLANYILSLIVVIFIIIAMGVMPHWTLVFFPLLILPVMLLGIGMGLFISLIGVVLPDVQRIINMGIGFVMYLTPIVYSKKIENDLLRAVIEYNPLTYLIAGVRDQILLGSMDFPERFLFSAAGSLIIFLISWRIFFIAEEKVIEKMM